MTVNLGEAKAHLGRYVTKAAAGEIVTICERNKSIAELHPARVLVRTRKLKIGSLAGQFEVPDDFNEALPEFEAAFYGQGGKKAKRLMNEVSANWI